MNKIEPPKPPPRHRRAAHPLQRLAARAGLLPLLPMVQPALTMVLLPALAYMLLVRLPAILAVHPATWHRLPPSLLQQQMSLDIARGVAADLASFTSAFFTALLASSFPLSY